MHHKHPSREALFKYKKIYDHQGSESLFIAAMKESVDYHRGQCQFYDNLCRNRGFESSVVQNIDDLSKIPAIPVDYFKTHEVRSISLDEVEVHATSSGTLGQKSQVFLSKSDLNLGTKMIIRSMNYHRFISIVPTNYLLLGFEPVKGNDMGNVKVLKGMTRLAPAINIDYAIKHLGGTYQIDYFGILGTLKKYAFQHLPVRIFGFPSYLYMMLTTMKQMQMKPLKLGKRSVIFTGGGWKKHDNMKIDKHELHNLIEEMLGIPRENCRDFYSAVEHSVAYPECKHHHMHVPIWSRVIIRDLTTLEPVGFDTPGFLNFVSPLITGMPLSSVLMSDLAVLRDGSHCGCGITTPYFEILGRAVTQSSRTCAVHATELMGGA